MGYLTKKYHQQYLGKVHLKKCHINCKAECQNINAKEDINNFFTRIYARKKANLYSVFRFATIYVYSLFSHKW